MNVASKIFFAFCVLFSGNSLRAQVEFSKWTFGAKAGLDFTTQPPTPFSYSALQTFEGVASICDTAGYLMFYTDGCTVYNDFNGVMPNGTGLDGNSSSTQSAIIVKQPGNNKKYYIFTTEQLGFPNGFRYSIVDMGLAGGTGSVTIKNFSLYGNTCEKQVAVRHCNGKDVWIVSHEEGAVVGNRFWAYLLTSSGLSAPVISVVGQVIFNGSSFDAAAAGQMKVSPDGKKLAMATAAVSINNWGNGGFQLFDFDNMSGVVSNFQILLDDLSLTPSNTAAYGVEFSPDGSKLYGSTASTDSTTTTLYQWNICAPTTSAMIASQYSVDLNSFESGSLQRAIDGKIYLSQAGSQSLCVISNPNGSGVAMNYIPNGLSVAPKMAFYGLPNFINQYSHISPSPFTFTANCQTASFSAPLPPVSPTGCSPLPNVPLAMLWNFGDPASGSANTSQFSNPTHIYSSAGTFSVSLILYFACTNDTIRQTLAVSPDYSVNVAGNFQICQGDQNTYTVSGGSSYLWSDSTTNATAILSPTITSICSVTAVVNGCNAINRFVITVDRCLGITVTSNSRHPRIFPNPVKNEFTVESETPADLQLFDMNGVLLLSARLDANSNVINTADLPQGVYTLLFHDELGTGRARLVKVE